MTKTTDFGMNYRGIIISHAFHHQPKKKASLLAYGDSDTNAIYRNIREQFTPRCSQAAGGKISVAFSLDNQPQLLYTVLADTIHYIIASNRMAVEFWRLL